MTIDGVAVVQHGAVTFVAGPPSAAGSTLVALPASGPDDGTPLGGVPAEVLGDNSRCLVIGRNREAQTVVTFNPAYLAFCRDWDVPPRACASRTGFAQADLLDAVEDLMKAANAMPPGIPYARVRAAAGMLLTVCAVPLRRPRPRGPAA